MKLREEFSAKLKNLLAASALSAEKKAEIRKRYAAWSDYYDKRLFNAGKVAAQTLCGSQEADDELKLMTAHVIVETALALEDFAQQIIFLQVKLAEDGHDLRDLRTLTEPMARIQQAVRNSVADLGIGQRGH